VYLVLVYGITGDFKKFIIDILYHTADESSADCCVVLDDGTGTTTLYSVHNSVVLSRPGSQLSGDVSHVTAVYLLYSSVQNAAVR
jgi:hypothetical protein